MNATIDSLSCNHDVDQTTLDKYYCLFVGLPTSFNVMFFFFFFIVYFRVFDILSNRTSEVVGCFPQGSSGSGKTWRDKSSYVCCCACEDTKRAWSIRWCGLPFCLLGQEKIGRGKWIS